MVREFFSRQKRYLDHFFQEVDLEKADEIVSVMEKAQGTVFFTGVGKSGTIAEKIVQTLISTGTRAMHLESMNALHGDIGILREGDILVLLTKSGDTPELLNLLTNVKRKANIHTMVWTSNPNGHIVGCADSHMVLPLEGEICPFDLAPTTSCALQLIFGDIIAMELMKRRAFTLGEYALNHPAGSIGQKISLTVEDIMYEGDELPVCYAENQLKDVLVILSNKRCGCVLIVDQETRLLGIFTDGDLRRAIQGKQEEVFSCAMGELMTQSALTTHKKALARDALKVMQGNPEKKVMMLPVLEEGKLVGLVHMHDVVSPFRRQRSKRLSVIAAN